MTDATDLKKSTRAHCLHWLARGHCDDPMCTLNEEQQRWLKDLEGWTRDGNPELMYAYPKRLSLFDLQDIVERCFQLAFRVAVECDTEPGRLVVKFRWHNVGPAD